MKTMFAATQLTVKEGLAIQAEQMAEWRTVLNDDAYKKLAEWVRLRNEFGYEHGFQVTRGMHLSEFVGTLAMQNRQSTP